MSILWDFYMDNRYEEMVKNDIKFIYTGTGQNILELKLLLGKGYNFKPHGDAMLITVISSGIKYHINKGYIITIHPDIADNYKIGEC